MSATEQSRAPAENRQRLLEALADAIRERGLRGTQIADIVRRARTSRRTFYECFDDKESCFVELVREATTQMLATIEQSVDLSAPWDVQIDQAIDIYVQALAEDPAMTATISRELPALGLRGAAVQREGIERYAGFMVRMLGAEPIRAAGVRAPSVQTAVMLLGGVNELVIHAVDHGQPLSTVADVAKDVIKAVLDPGRAPASS
jgi:AcrR family transcriptional regulator